MRDEAMANLIGHSRYGIPSTAPLHTTEED